MNKKYKVEILQDNIYTVIEIKTRNTMFGGQLSDCVAWISLNEMDLTIKELQYHKDKTVGLYAFDKKIDTIFKNIPDTNSCKTVVEAYLIQQINYLKNIIFQIE